MTNPISIERRGFLVKSAALTGGLALGIHLPLSAEAAEPTSQPEVTHWIVIQPDETVVVRIARSELGQGTFTGLAMLAAEELECDWSKVKPEYADVNEHVRRDRIFGSMSTGGSRGIRDSNEYMRQGGAAAREMLIAAAAQQWGVPAAECSVAKGVISHAASNRTTTYGKVAAAASKLEVPKQPKLKDPKQWTLIGTSPARFDIPDKTTGKQIYAADVRLPGLLHASIVQAPVFGAKLKRFDDSNVKSMRGVKRVVKGDDWVAVVADNWWRANQALKAMPVEWTASDNDTVSSESIKQFLRTGIDAKDVPVARKDGDFENAIAGAAKVVEAEYYAPYLNHATIEPQTATALIKDDTVEVWVGTQNGETTIAAASEAGIPLNQVYVHKMHAGGGFGRRGPHQEYTKQAVAIAQTMRRHAGALAVVARRGHASGALSPGGAGEAARGARRAGQLDGVARAAGRPVDLHHGAAERHQERDRPGECALLSGFALRRSQLHGRVRHAQPACAARLLACGGAHQQSVLPRVLHR